MYYAGIDLHKKFVQVSVNDDYGQEIANQKISCQADEIARFFSKFNNVQPVSGVIEATANWPWLTRLLTSQGIDVCLAHPLKTKAIASARIKTDKIDAKTLADLLRARLIPQSYMATTIEQNQRDLVRHRLGLVRQKTMIKNRIHAILARQNISQSKSDLFGKKGRQFLKQVTAADFPWLSNYEKLLIKENLELIDFLRTKIKTIDAVVSQEFSTNQDYQLLLTIPGFGMVTAATLVSELGNVNRFKDEKQVVGYIGLAPSVYSSGGKTRTGSITKLGNPIVRWVLVQAAYRAIKRDPYLTDFYQRITSHSDKKKAIVAVARKLLVSSYMMLKNHQSYQFRPVTSSQAEIIPKA